MGPASADITASVVVYRDYGTPLKMVGSLAENLPAGLSVSLTVVDNSCPEGDAELGARRDAFRERLEGYGFASYVDAGGNLGFGRANNLALMAADSEYHAFVNPDVLFTEDALGGLKSFLDARPQAGMAVPRILGEGGEPQRVYWRDPSVLDAFNRMFLKGALRGREAYYNLEGEDRSRPFRVPFAQGSFLFGRTALLQGLGGFDESFFMYLEDADLCRRVNERSELLYCPDVSVVHAWGRGSHGDARLLARHVGSYLRYFRKWGLRLA